MTEAYVVLMATVGYGVAALALWLQARVIAVLQAQAGDLLNRVQAGGSVSDYVAMRAAAAAGSDEAREEEPEPVYSVADPFLRLDNPTRGGRARE